MITDYSNLFSTSGRFFMTYNSHILMFGLKKATYLNILLNQDNYSTSQKTKDEDNWFVLNRAYIRDTYKTSKVVQRAIEGYFLELGLIETKVVGDNEVHIRFNHDVSLFVRDLAIQIQSVKVRPKDVKEFIDDNIDFTKLKEYLDPLYSSFLSNSEKPQNKKVCLSKDDVESLTIDELRSIVLGKLDAPKIQPAKKKKPKEKLDNSKYKSELKVVEIWNEKVVNAKNNISKVRAKDAILNKIKARLKTFSTEEVKEAFKNIRKSDFLNSEGFFCASWMFKNDENFEKVLNGNYANKENSYGKKVEKEKPPEDATDEYDADALGMDLDEYQLLSKEEKKKLLIEAGEW